MAISGEGTKFHLIRCADNDEWLEQRTKGVGGSDVAAIMGFSPWRTPAQVWFEKTGRVEPEDISDKPYVQFGNIMEPLVGKWYAEQHPDRTVRRVNAVCQSIERPWAQASLDYEVKDGLMWGVLEIKTARSAKDWADGVPPYYLTQIYHYMSVLNRPFADVAVFFRDTCEFKEFRVEYDPEDGKAVDSDVDAFWHDFVEADVMPELVGTSGEIADLTGYYGKPTGDFVHAGAEADELIAAYQDAAYREKQARADKTAAGARLTKLIGEAKGIETDVARVTWARSERETFDTKALKEALPDVYARYAKRSIRNGGLRIKELA